MDESTRSMLLEILDLLRSMVNTPMCGFQFCEQSQHEGMISLCEHVNKCRANYQLHEHILELRERIGHFVVLEETT